MNRNVLLAAVGSLVLILLVWWFMLYSPRNQQLSDAKLRTETAEAEVQSLELAIARLKAAQAEEPLKRSQLEELRAAVPDQPNLAQFILDANEAALRSGIDFLSISPGEPAVPAAGAEAAASTITLSLSITGGYFQTLDFLNRLSSMPRIIVVDNLQIGPEDETASSLSISIAGRMFTRAAAEETTPTTVPPAGAPTTTAPAATTTTAAA